jgi:hypothetical protein
MGDFGGSAERRVIINESLFFWPSIFLEDAEGVE